MSSKYYDHYQAIRRQIFKDELSVKLQGPPRRANPKEQLKHKQAQLAMEHAVVEARHRMMQQAEYQAMLKMQFEHFVRDQARMRETLPGLVRSMRQEEPRDVTKKFQDADPFLRWVAIQVAAKRWMPVEKEMIGLLDDPYPGIRDAAHQALVRLSRGNDFGPPANASASQIETAQNQWQRWLALQFTQRQEGSRN